MNKISLDQVNQDHRKIAEIFVCFFNTSHLVEDPLICPTQGCQRLFCKSCLLSTGFCKSCGRKIESNQGPLLPLLQNYLNKIYLKCENRRNGCMAEIDYQSYRSHTRNCRFQNFLKETNQPVRTKFDIEFSDEFLKMKKRADLEMLTSDQLKRLLENRNINPKGCKEDLIFKLLVYPLFKVQEIFQNFDMFLVYINDKKEKLWDKTMLQVKQILSEMGQPTNGTKTELIERAILKGENHKTGDKQYLNQTKGRRYRRKKGEPKFNSLTTDDDFDSEDNESEGDSMDEGYKPNSNQPKMPVSTGDLTDRQLKKMKMNDMESLTVSELREILQKRNIPRTGSKEDLINKLQTYLLLKKEKNLDSKSKKIKKMQKLEEKSIDELKHLLWKKNLPVSGTRTELMERLLA